MYLQSDKFFDKIFNNLLKIEGNYVNDELDRGGETYKGIARNFNEDWRGWQIIDNYKLEFPNLFKNKNYQKINEILNQDKNLQKFVKDFYKKYYYKNHLNELYQIGINYDKENSEKIISKLFDFAVNTGSPKTAIKYLQQALNYLNRNGKDFEDLVVDSLFGQKTLNAFKIITQQRNLDILYTVIQCLQCRKYLELMDKNPKYEKYRGWFRRVKK